MSRPALDFYFEFASPYAYFASLRVEDLCARHGLELAWKPVMLGAILTHTGGRPLLSDGVRGDYARMDCLRWAAMHDIPFRLPVVFPTNSLKAARGAVWLEGVPVRASYIHACFRAHWVQGLELFDDEVMADIVRGLGEDVEAFFAAISAPALKQRLMDQTEEARQRGVFGAPTFFHGDEMVWGNDRMDLLEKIIQVETARSA